MKITKAIIKNYKSIGEESNILVLNEDITTIIGKNESGKTNILSALAECKYNQKPNFASKFNKNSSFNETEIILELDFKETEVFNVSTLSTPHTTVVFKHNTACLISGALKELIDGDVEIKTYKDILLQAVENISVRVDVSVRDNIIKKFLTEAIGDKYISEYSSFFTNCQAWISNKYLKAVDGKELTPILDGLKNKLYSYYLLLPFVYSFYPTEFKTRYSLDEIQKDHDILKLFKVCDIEKEDIITALSTNSDISKKAISRRKIETNIENLSRQFSSFYQKENIKIVILFDNNYFDLLIDNANLPVAISERSNGLRWYLDLFVHLKSQNLLNREILLLVDEPGVYLHIDAQKKLLELFDDLAGKNQIIYTTHSPFMIDTNALTRIALVESVCGYTKIFNKCHAANLTAASKMEILSPLIKALGFSMKYNLGPNFDKLNLIVEGVSDYYYLQGALIACNIEREKMPYIIPSVGVNNIHNIASILIGWGIDFKIVTDFDAQAYNEVLQLEKLGLKGNEHYFNLMLKAAEKETMRESPFVIENMFTEEDFKLFNQGEKHLSSKYFYGMVRKGELKLSDETITNFRRLFSALL